MAVKGFLISVAGYPLSPTSFLPDNGLANLAGSLIQEGHKVKILDFNTPRLMKRLFPKKFSMKIKPLVERIITKTSNGESPRFKDILSLLFFQRRIGKFQKSEFYKIANEIAEAVEKERVDFVGLKLWNGDGFDASLIIANVLKKNCPHIPVFAGGPHVDMFRENIFKATNSIDALVYGEGEETISLLANYVEGKNSLEEIPNLIFKKNGRVFTTPIKRIEKLDKLPYPVYDEEVYPAMVGNQKIKMIVLDESRGCSHACYFCIHPIKSGKLRSKSAERIVSEIERIKNKYGINIFRYAGSNTPYKLMKEVARMLIEKKIEVEYTTFGSVKGCSLEDFKLLKESGCYAIFFGIETGDEEILRKYMNKNTKVEEMRKALKYTKESGILTAASLIYPAPGETKRTKEKTLKLLTEGKVDSAPVQFPIICPQTEWEKAPEKYGFSVNRSQYLQKAMNYKIRFLFPPRFWEPFPYKINGKKFKDYAKDAENFVKELERNKIVTGISDEMFLLAKYAEFTPKEFRDFNRICFLTGNSEGIEEEIAKINKNITINKFLRGGPNAQKDGAVT